MNAKELRAAAQYFADHEHCECDHSVGIFNCIGCGVGRMASHILATVRDDDDEGVTDEWWRTLNVAWFASCDEGTEVCCIVVHDDQDEDQENRCLIVRADDGSFGFWEQSRKTQELHSPHHGKYRKLKTRGDVRKLCLALGIELKEPQQ